MRIDAVRNPLIAQRLFNTPLLIHPAKLDAVLAGLGDRIGLAAYPAPEPSAFTSQTSQPNENGLYRQIGDIAVFDVVGVLAHRGGLTADSSYVLGYQTIARQLTAALDDPAVRGIVLNVDSPGGEVAGAFDLAALVREGRGRKPIRAVAADLAASAAYLIASAADSLAVTQTGYVGSVGVVMRHVDLSQALDQEGITVTHIFAGEHKIDGHPYAPLPDHVKNQFQDEIDGLYELFVEAVAAHTGLTPKAVRDTQAHVFRGRAAVENGLAQYLATPDQVIARLQAELSARPARVSPSRRKRSMSTESIDSDELDLIRAERYADGFRDGQARGAEAERARICAILTHAEAAGRTAQAIALAEAGLAVESAARVLAASPRPAPASAFAAHMAALGNPDLGPEPLDEADETARLIAAGVALLPAHRRAAPR
jgi:signal peptide peptidase SppA